MKYLLSLVLACAVFAQEKPNEKAPSAAEEEALSQALGETGNSPIEFVRAIESHLKRFPETTKRAELERALVKAAIENKDDKRIIAFGERVLAREADDVQVLDRFTRALLTSDDKAPAERALPYAKRYVTLLTGMRSKPAPNGMNAAQWQEELDKGIGRALALQARATGNGGNVTEAAHLAQKSWEASPGIEAAREWGRWLARSGKEDEAVLHLADAFVLADPRKSDADQKRDRDRMGEYYRKVHGNEKGLGDIILEAYDRNAKLQIERRDRLQNADPNAAATKVLEFTLPEQGGKQKLALASLKGKVIVFDFWATWCGPCRAQQPLYEEVKKRFKGKSDVVFLSVNTDEDRSLVAPFLKEQKWAGPVYFEDGLSRTLRIDSIPMTLIVDKQGEVFSRMNGYVPQRFVDMLSERINEAVKN